MAKNVLMRHWNGTDFEEIHPVTKASNIYVSDGKTVEEHVANKNNPHSVTKSQVGLGSVGNYGIATQAEAEAGTSAVKYMTPQRTAQAISPLAPPAPVQSVAGKTGTVVLSKGDVGLGNVDNVQQAPLSHVGTGGAAHANATTSTAGFMSAVDKNKLDGIAAGAQANRVIATQAQAEAGTDNTTDMTPLRTAQAIVTKTGNLSNLQTSDKSSLVGAVNELFTSASNGKSAVAAAITGMGQAASGSDTYSQLATKIGNISKDADAAAGDVLAGKTYYQGGLKRAGTMVKRGALNQTITTQNGVVNLSAGYFSGGQIKATFANLVAGNVKSGVDIGGVTGTLQEEVDFPAGDVVVADFIYVIRLNTGSGAYRDPTRYREAVINKRGIYRISFTIYSNTSSVAALGRIYKNGQPYGMQRSATSTVTFTEDLLFEAGDLCQFYFWGSASYDGSEIVNTGMKIATGVSIPTKTLSY